MKTYNQNDRGLKSYNEARNGCKMDWNVFLDSVDASECSSYDAMQAEDLAGSWVTCACGNLCDVIPRINKDEAIVPWHIGQPKDHKLANLGMEFYSRIKSIHTNIRSGCYVYTTEAREALKAIEERATNLLKNLKIEQ